MQVCVENCKDPVFEQTLIHGAKVFGNYLFSHQMRPYIHIDIVMKSRLDVLGSCAVVYYNDWYKPREFEIELRKYRSIDKTLEALAHEMVHAKQFAKGELNVDLTKWCGKQVKDDTPYADLPWENEALCMEPVLMDLYRANINNINIL